MLVVSSLLLFSVCCLSCWLLSFVGSLFVCCCWLVLLRAVRVDDCCECLFVFLFAVVVVFLSLTVAGVACCVFALMFVGVVCCRCRLSFTIV